MECCVGVSTETVLQIIKFYTVVKSILKLTFWTVVRKNDRSEPVSRHFNSSDHSISNFVAFGLSVINGGNDCRKTKEMRLIHALGTLNPHGINERFTFC